MPTTTIDYGDDAATIGLASVRSPRELAACLGIRYSTLIYFANAGRRGSYSIFEVRKRSGAPRQIEAPFAVLKHIQRTIAQELTTVYKPPKCVHGFIPGRNIVTNAAPHAGKRWVVNLDLRDFFPSVHLGRVRGVLIAAPYSLPASVATVIARLCCHRDRLPQGAPTSPVLANMVARALDTKLRELARKHHITYTRYADDITFSGHSRTIPSSLAVAEAGIFRCGEHLRELIQRCGFSINEDKFRVHFAGMRKEVTGLVVNDHVNVRRRFARQIRAMLHAWRTHGYDAAAREYELKYWAVRTSRNTKAPSFKRVLRGKLEYLRHVKGETDLVFSLYQQLATLDDAPSLRCLVEEMERRRATLADKLDRAVFVLESEEKAEQGTGFLVAGVGIVTCAHVIQSDTLAFRPQHPDRRHHLRLKHVDENRDVAVLEFVDSAPHHGDYLDADATSELPLGALVTIAGFANYAPGASLSIKTAQVSQRRRWFDHNRFNVSTGIIAGMSGGPVLNSAGSVVGVAATGSSANNETDDPDARHAVIPWSEVQASIHTPSTE